MEHYKKLKRGCRNFMVPTRLDSLMCDALSVSQDRTGKISVTYSGGDMVEVQSDKDLMEFSSIFEVVGFVRSTQGTN